MTITWQLAADASIPRAACVRVYPVAVSEGVVFVWMGNDPWGEGAKDILPVPSTGQNLDKSKVRTRGVNMSGVRAALVRCEQFLLLQ